MPGGLEDERHRSSFFKTQLFRIRKAVHFRTFDEFRAAAIVDIAEIAELAALVVLAGEAGGASAATHAWREQDLLARRDTRYFRADFGNFSGNVASWNVRERDWHAREAGPHPEIEMIQCTGADADENVASAELGFRGVRVFEDLRTAVLVKPNGFHKAPLETQGSPS